MQQLQAWFCVSCGHAERLFLTQSKHFCVFVISSIMFKGITMAGTYKILICDSVGLAFDAHGDPDPAEVQAHIEAKGGVFHRKSVADHPPVNGKLNFYYLPELSTEQEIATISDAGQYDAVIAAATVIPKRSLFALGGVRIGAGTGNMQADCFGKTAPLMNTPGFNSRATAQMAMKALLRVRPSLPVQALHTLTVAGLFDTGKHLRDYPTAKLEGQTMAIIGYGNIGREIALLGKAFHMKVKVFARNHHRARIVADGMHYAASPEEAASGADVLSVHIGLGPRSVNAGFIDATILSRLNHGAVLINYDRGECVAVKALHAAMAEGVVAHAAIDADIFVDENGSLRGPLVPYLDLEKSFPGRLELLPHAAADTDHPSRVAGAKQAVHQIFESLINKRVINCVGVLPPGYIDGGSVKGV
jgi:lactate dehydrogenase-like 2-hydroxyacid dehydrogenase